MNKAQVSSVSVVTPKTGRRPNPTIDGPRDQTVCFMLSKGEKLAVDRLANSMNITRSGVLAAIVAEFVEATKSAKDAAGGEKRLIAYLEECRESLKKRNDEAAEGFSAQPERFS